jgi:hypothetical protein
MLVALALQLTAAGIVAAEAVVHFPQTRSSLETLPGHDAGSLAMHLVGSAFELISSPLRILAVASFVEIAFRAWRGLRSDEPNGGTTT